MRGAILHVIALAHVAVTTTRSWAADSPLVRVRLRGEVDQLRQEIALLREELRIKDARLARIPPRERPHYPAPERLAILALRAARGWSIARAARAFLVAPPTIAAWMRRLDEDGPDALVKLPVPVNRLPDFAAVVVQELRAVCPSLGKVRIAQLLARAGLALSASTARRVIIGARRRRPPDPVGPETAPLASAPGAPSPKRRVVTARRPHHVWHADLTVVPTALGFWVPWLPFALAQRWPFGAWIAVVLDHFSRAVVAAAVFDKEPTAADVCAVFDRAIGDAGAAPRYIVTDQGTQFRDDYRAWCRQRGIRPRFGAVGRQGSIAVIERFIGSLKRECLHRIVVPLSLPRIDHEIDLFVRWYHEVRPHQGLGGRTPAELLARPAEAGDGDGASKPRPRARKRAPPGRPMTPLGLVVTHLEGRPHLPIVQLRRAA